jgi:predicted RNA-binding protein
MSRGDELPAADWTGALQRQAHLLHQQIAAMQRLVADSGGSEEMLYKSCASYYRLLDVIYEKEMPVARTLDGIEPPVLGDEVMEFKGQVRAIDLDLRRFELRRIDGGNLPDLRCIYPASFDSCAVKWLNQVMVVRGQVEMYQGVARLLQVQAIVAGN